MDWHSPEAVIGGIIAWSGLLLGAIKWLFTREMSRLDAKLKVVDDHEKAIADLKLKAAAPGNCQQHAQQIATFGSLDARMDRVEGLVNRVDGRLEGIGRAVDLMNEFLINRGDK